MPYHTFLWTSERIEHIADNDVTPEEFERIVCDPDRTGWSFSTGLPAAFGYANDGRYLFCVYEEADELQVIPVTAYQIMER